MAGILYKTLPFILGGVLWLGNPGGASAAVDDLTAASNKSSGQVPATQGSQDVSQTPAYYVVNGQTYSYSQLPSSQIGSDGNFYPVGGGAAVPPSYNIGGQLYTAANLPAGYNISNGVIYAPGQYVPPQTAAVGGAAPVQALPYVAPRPAPTAPSGSPSTANNYGAGNYVAPVVNQAPAFIPPALDTSSQSWAQNQIAAEATARANVSSYCSTNPGACPPSYQSTYGTPMTHVLTAAQAPAVNPAAKAGSNGGTGIMGETIANPNAASQAAAAQQLAATQAANQAVSQADANQAAAVYAQQQAAAAQQQTSSPTWYALPPSNGGGGGEGGGN